MFTTFIKELESLVLNKKLNDKKIDRLRSQIKHDKIRNYMRLVKRVDAGDEEVTKELEELVWSLYHDFGFGWV